MFALSFEFGSFLSPQFRSTPLAEKILGSQTSRFFSILFRSSLISFNEIK